MQNQVLSWVPYTVKGLHSFDIIYSQLSFRDNFQIRIIHTE